MSSALRERNRVWDPVCEQTFVRQQATSSAGKPTSLPAFEPLWVRLSCPLRAEVCDFGYLQV